MYKRPHIGDGKKGGYVCKGIESGQHVREMVMNVVEERQRKKQQS
jgi:hypothetical protein